MGRRGKGYFVMGRPRGGGAEPLRRTPFNKKKEKKFRTQISKLFWVKGVQSYSARTIKNDLFPVFPILFSASGSKKAQNLHQNIYISYFLMDRPLRPYPNELNGRLIFF